MIYKQIFDQIYDAVEARMAAHTDSIAWYDKFDAEMTIIDSYKHTEYESFVKDIHECIINELS